MTTIDAPLIRGYYFNGDPIVMGATGRGHKQTETDLANGNPIIGRVFGRCDVTQDGELVRLVVEPTLRRLDTSGADDLSRIRHALCIALDVDPALNEPTYDLLLRLIARGPKVVTFDPSVSTWHYRGFQTSGVVEPVTVTFNERPHDPALVSLLRQAEWAGVSLSGDAAVPACPWCDNDGSAGHATECPVAPILYPKES